MAHRLTRCQFGRRGRCDHQPDDPPSRELLGGEHRPLVEAIPFGSDQDYLPFWAAGTPRPEGLVNNLPSPFLDPQISNEVALAPTRADRSGEVFFEVQTLRQSAGLNCGAPVTVGGPGGRHS